MNHLLRSYLRTHPSRAPEWAARNFIALGVLLLCLVAVHFVIAAYPGAPRPGQAGFGWPALARLGGIALVSTYFLNLTRLRGLWDAELSVATKFVRPFLLGAGLGALMLAQDLLTGASAAVAERLKIPMIHIEFPLSVPIYFGAALLVSTAYFLYYLPFAYWLIAEKILKGRHELVAFWVIGIPLSLIEMATAAKIDSEWMLQDPLTYIPGKLVGISLTLTQVWYFRTAGFIACCSVRLGFYLVWHIVNGALIASH